MKNFHTIAPILLTSITTICIFALTNYPATSGFKLQMMLLSFLVVLFLSFHQKKSGQTLYEAPAYVSAIVIFVLFLIGATGWFFSPFFFLFYLLAILLSFIFPRSISVSLVVTLIGLFSFAIGEVDAAYDFVILLSLLSVIPLSFYISNQYLKLKEKNKEIFILEADKKQYENTIDQMLGNKMHKFAAEMRQILNNTKQFAFTTKRSQMFDKVSIDNRMDTIIHTTEEGLKLMNSFEHEVTGKHILSSVSPKTKPLKFIRS